jgi:hypothetical protein
MARDPERAREVANETSALRGGSPIAGVRTAMAFVEPPVDRGRATLRLRVLAWFVLGTRRVRLGTTIEVRFL